MKLSFLFCGFAFCCFSASASEVNVANISTMTLENADFGEGPETDVKVAQIYGDPKKSGMFIQWMKMPAGAETPPHWHSSDEIFTVISGSIGLGIGDKLDKKLGKEIKAGGFAVVPAKAHHFGWSREGAVIQVQGQGPFHMNWLKH